MTKETVTEVVKDSEAFDTFMSKLNAGIDLISSEIVNKAPEAYDAILTIVQMQAIFGLTTSALIFVISSFILFRTYKIGRTLDWTYPEPVNMVWLVKIFLLTAVSLGTFTYLGAFTHWLPAIYPEGALAVKALAVAGVDLF